MSNYRRTKANASCFKRDRPVLHSFVSGTLNVTSQLGCCQSAGKPIGKYTTYIGLNGITNCMVYKSKECSFKSRTCKLTIIYCGNSVGNLAKIKANLYIKLN